MRFIYGICLFFTTTYASEPTSPIPILKQDFTNNPTGSHNYILETGNGIYEDQQGFLKNPNTYVVQGQVQYVSPDGQLIYWRYISDEHGYRVEGEHLPKTPTIPATVRKSMNLTSLKESSKHLKSNIIDNLSEVR